MSRFMRRAQRRTEERGRVLALFDADPYPLYGLDIIRRANVRAGRLMSLLDELLAEGEIIAAWDEQPGKHRRRHYMRASWPRLAPSDRWQWPYYPPEETP